MSYNISKAFVPLIKSLEGYKLVKYKDAAGLDTIGVGHLIVEPYDKGLDQAAGIIDSSLIDSLTEDQCDDLLVYDTELVVVFLNKLLAGTKLTPNQFDALVSFTYNVGNTSFRKSTAFLRILDGKYTEAMDSLITWFNVRKGGELEFSKGLYIRRLIERFIFEGKIPLEIDNKGKLNDNDRRYVIEVVKEYYKNLTE